jgi:hypothetical protein
MYGNLHSLIQMKVVFSKKLPDILMSLYFESVSTYCVPDLKHNIYLCIKSKQVYFMYINIPCSNYQYFQISNLSIVYL